MRIVGTHHKLDYDEYGELLEDKYLILVHGINPQGSLMITTETHTNHWLTPKEYQLLEKRFGDIDETLRFIRDSSAFISETKYNYNADAY